MRGKGRLCDRRFLSPRSPFRQIGISFFLPSYVVIFGPKFFIYIKHKISCLEREILGAVNGLVVLYSMFLICSQKWEIGTHTTVSFVSLLLSRGSHLLAGKWRSNVLQVSGIASHRRVLPVSDRECSFFPYQILMLMLLGVGGRERRGDGFFVLVKGGFASLLLCPMSITFVFSSLWHELFIGLWQRACPSSANVRNCSCFTALVLWGLEYILHKSIYLRESLTRQIIVFPMFLLSLATSWWFVVSRKGWCGKNDLSFVLSIFEVCEEELSDRRVLLLLLFCTGRSAYCRKGGKLKPAYIPTNWLLVMSRTCVVRWPLGCGTCSDGGGGGCCCWPRGGPHVMVRGGHWLLPVFILQVPAVQELSEAETGTAVAELDTFQG